MGCPGWSHSVCEGGSFQMPQTDWFDDAIPHPVSLTPRWHFTVQNSTSMEEHRFTKTTNTHTLLNAYSYIFPWAFTKCALVFLKCGSFELNKQINQQAKQFSVQKSSLQCLVCRAVNLWLMNMDIYYGRVNRAMQAEQLATLLFTSSLVHGDECKLI